jgi:hypothetical protein
MPNDTASRCADTAIIDVVTEPRRPRQRMLVRSRAR